MYADHPNYWTQLAESQRGTINTQYSLGLQLGADASVIDVIVGGLADKAGFGAGMKVVAVNGRAYSWALLRAAIKESSGAANRQPIEFIVENTGYYKVIRMDYHGGEKYPDLERVGSVPARLDDILQPMTK